MEQTKITLVEDFSDCPGGRYRHQGDFSGEEFREEHLKPALEKSEKVIVDLNGAFTIPASFLDESFGPLVNEFGHETLAKRLEILLEDDPVAKRTLDDVFNKHAA